MCISSQNVVDLSVEKNSSILSVRGHFIFHLILSLIVAFVSDE